MNVKCGAINCNYKYKSLADSINHIKSTHPDIISNLKQRDLDWNKFIEYLKVKGISSVVKISQLLQDYANGKIHINNLPHEYDGKPFPQMETYNKYLRNTSDQLKKVLKGGDPLTYYWCPSLNITSFDKDMPCDTDVHKIEGKNMKGGTIVKLNELKIGGNYWLGGREPGSFTVYEGKDARNRHNFRLKEKSMARPGGYIRIIEGVTDPDYWTIKEVLGNITGHVESQGNSNASSQTMLLDGGGKGFSKPQMTKRKAIATDNPFVGLKMPSISEVIEEHNKRDQVINNALKRDLLQPRATDGKSPKSEILYGGTRNDSLRENIKKIYNKPKKSWGFAMIDEYQAYSQHLWAMSTSQKKARKVRNLTRKNKKPVNHKELSKFLNETINNMINIIGKDVEDYQKKINAINMDPDAGPSDINKRVEYEWKMEELLGSSYTLMNLSKDLDFGPIYKSKGGKKTRRRKKKGGLLIFPPVIPVSLGYYLYQTKMNGKKAIFNWPVQYKNQDPVTKGGKRRRRTKKSKHKYMAKRKTRRRKTKRRTRRRRKGGSTTNIGNITITSSSKPNPGVAIARAIEKTYSSDYAGHCRNHSVRLYGKPGAWAEATEKECLDEVKKFSKRVFKRPPRRGGKRRKTRKRTRRRRRRK